MYITLALLISQISEHLMIIVCACTGAVSIVLYSGCGPLYCSTNLKDCIYDVNQCS